MSFNISKCAIGQSIVCFTQWAVENYIRQPISSLVIDLSIVKTNQQPGINCDTPIFIPQCICYALRDKYRTGPEPLSSNLRWWGWDFRSLPKGRDKLEDRPYHQPRVVPQSPVPQTQVRTMALPVSYTPPSNIKYYKLNTNAMGCVQPPLDHSIGYEMKMKSCMFILVVCLLFVFTWSVSFYSYSVWRSFLILYFVFYLVFYTLYYNLISFSLLYLFAWPFILSVVTLYIQLQQLSACCLKPKPSKIGFGYQYILLWVVEDWSASTIIMKETN